jgi:hypothetical protein
VTSVNCSSTRRTLPLAFGAVSLSDVSPVVSSMDGLSE